MPVLNKDSQSVKSILVSCDQCHSTFELSEYKKESVILNQNSLSNQKSVEGINKDIEHIYFNCPSCGHTYTCYYTDEYTRKLQAELRYTHRQQAIKPNAKIARQVQQLEQSIKRAMDSVRAAANEPSGNA